MVEEEEMRVSRGVSRAVLKKPAVRVVRPQARLLPPSAGILCPPPCLPVRDGREAKRPVPLCLGLPTATPSHSSPLWAREGQGWPATATFPPSGDALGLLRL